jgi:putative ABC transport system permease protein
LAAFVLITLYTARGMLLKEVAEKGGKEEPNLVLFGIQKDQRDALRNLVQSFKLRLYEELPIVIIRLSAVKGRPVEEIQRDAHSRIPSWALSREYRSTYRSGLGASEQIVDGIWQNQVSAGAPIPVSLEQGIADALQVRVGDALEFELQGVFLPARVASIRKVDWQRFRPNFFVLFPEGVLENAPQFFALVTRTDSSEISARFQREVAESFPSVSMIDLTLVLDTLDSILGKISAAAGFVALFIILTGMAVLLGAVLSGRSQRLKESVLMRTLGARRSQILGAIFAEYLFLGMISCLAGALLAAVAAWGLSFYFLGVVPSIFPLAMAVIPVLVTGATILAGFLGCWGIFRRPALESLRAET